MVVQKQHLTVIGIFERHYSFCRPNPCPSNLVATEKQRGISNDGDHNSIPQSQDTPTPTPTDTETDTDINTAPNMQPCSLAMRPQKAFRLVKGTSRKAGYENVQFEALSLFISIFGAEIRSCRSNSRMVTLWRTWPRRRQPLATFQWSYGQPQRWIVFSRLLLVDGRLLVAVYLYRR